LQSADLRRAVRLIEKWFARHQRPLPWRRSYDPYHVWLSEIMLQQTRMEVAVPYFERFLTRFPTVAALAGSTEDEVLSLWSGLGYYRRARMLLEGAKFVVERHGGIVPDGVERLLEIPGIGRYTAGAIASIAYGRPSPIVDGNVTRVTARLFGSDGDAWDRATLLVDAASSPRDLNQGLMELGALICTPAAPACPTCPARSVCIALADDLVASLPSRAPRKVPVALRVTLYLVRDSRGRVLMRRERGPLMNAMFHLPHGDTSLLSGQPLAAEPGAHLGSFRHTITTRKIEFSVHEATVGGLRESHDEYEWIDPSSLHDVPHPSYVKKALRVAGLHA
jgi:A/G-specific adenine glycosylase